MKQVRYIMLGGFLGAGKTTTLARLAQQFIQKGHIVGVVTNDQAQDLVDTNNLRSQGLTVEEVPGACFCCKFDELIDKTKTLDAATRPDILLAEPVGSCTDLVATVIQPLRDLYQDRFSIAPYAVLFKPSHGLRILKNESSGFSPKAAYIFRKQLEEADLIVINRKDELEVGKLAELQELLAAQFPTTPHLAISAKTGEGFQELTEFLNQEGRFGQRILEIDYDIYAAGEAELGWLNSSVRATFQHPTDIDAFILELVRRLHHQLVEVGAEIAHLKVIAMEDGGSFAVANVVSSDDLPKVSLAAQQQWQECDIVVNARVAIDPEILEKMVQETLQTLAQQQDTTIDWRQTQSFRPGRPTPTHRYDSAVNS